MVAVAGVDLDIWSHGLKTMQRIALVLEFDGSLYHGWQRQKNAGSVQQSLEEALCKMEGHAVEVVAAGRTDSGVHAKAMLAHADVSAVRWQRSSRAYTHGLNQLLPEAIRVTAVAAVAEDFHARFDCLERRYQYLIWNRTTASAIHRWRHWWVPRALDVQAMQEAASYLIGEHDFSAFRAAGCQASSPVRNLRHVGVVSHGCELRIDVHGDAFLYHMVRNITGNLVQVGMGKVPPARLAELLADGDRTQAAATAPAHGLYFMDALYADLSAQELLQEQSISG